MIPDFHLSDIAEQKLTGYLLDPSHKVGAAKLRFLESFGFSRDRSRGSPGGVAGAWRRSPCYYPTYAIWRKV
jgi:hypothetical protein